jgi:hypothetical protein
MWWEDEFPRGNCTVIVQTLVLEECDEESPDPEADCLGSGCSIIEVYSCEIEGPGSYECCPVWIAEVGGVIPCVGELGHFGLYCYCSDDPDDVIINYGIKFECCVNPM